MDHIHKILQLVADGVLSPKNAVAIFEQWREEGRELLLRPSANKVLQASSHTSKEEPPAQPEPESSLRDLITKELCEVVASSLKIDHKQISMKIAMQDYGIDSMTASDITGHFKDKYQIPLTPPTLFEVRNLGEYLDLIFQQFHSAFATYHQIHVAKPLVVEEPEIHVQGTAEGDEQNTTHVHNEALWEGGQDFDAYWESLAQSDVPAQAMRSDVPKGTAIHLDLGQELVEVISYGKGKPLVLIGGFGCGPLIWDQVLPSLIEKHRVLLYMPPGHGKSTLNSSFQHLSDVADILKDALDELSNSRINFK